MRRYQRLSRQRSSSHMRVESRVDVLEADVQNLTSRVDSGFKDMSANMRNLGEAISDLGKEMLSKPQPIPFKEILTTAATILAVVAYVNNFYETQSSKNLAPLMKEIEYMKLRIDRAELRAVKP